MVSYPHELFSSMDENSADELRSKLIAIYFEDHPEDMQDIIEGAEGHPDLIQVGQDEKINEVLSVDYGFNVEILNKREDDRIAELLVEEIDRFNQAGAGREVIEDISVAKKAQAEDKYDYKALIFNIPDEKVNDIREEVAELLEGYADDGVTFRIEAIYSTEKEELNEETK